MSLNPYYRLLLFISPFLLFSCATKEKPLTDQEVKDFARQVEVSVEKREAEFLNNAVYRKGLLKRANIPSAGNAGGFKAGLEKGLNLGTTMAQGLGEKALYNLVKQYKDGEAYHLIFRMYDNGSLNYHDYELVRVNGKPGIVDMFIYTTGQKLSESLRNIYLQFKDKMDDDKYFSKNDEWLKKMPEIRQYLNQGKHAEALELYNKVPADIRKGRSFQILHIEICSSLSSEEYSAALDEYSRLYPNEPNMHLLMLDGYVMKKEYAKALESVNALDKQVQKDPLLDYYRYLCYKLMEEPVKGKECLEKLVKNMPHFEDGVYAMIESYLSNGETEKARPLIEQYKAEVSFNQDNLNELLQLYDVTM